MDRLEALRVLMTVVEEESFAGAARRLRLSAPAVTRAVALWEARLGVQLLQRTTRVVRVTDAGARLVADARAWLAAWEETEARVLDGTQSPQGRLGVTASVMFGRLFVAPLVIEYLGLHPGVDVRALFVDRVVNLLEEGLDVAVRISALGDSSLHAVPVGRIRRVVVGAPAYLATHGRPRKPADLGRHRLITFSPDGVEAEWRFGRTGRLEVPKPVLVANNAELALGAAVAGLGLTRVLAYQALEPLRAGLLTVILAEHEQPPVPVHVVHAEGRHPTARVRAFRDLAVARLRAASWEPG